MACGILVPQPGIEPTPPAVEAQSLTHWTAREVPKKIFFKEMTKLTMMVAFSSRCVAFGPVFRGGWAAVTITHPLEGSSSCRFAH